MSVQRPRHTTACSLIASLLLVAGLLLATPADAGTAADEQLFVQLINQTRAGAGLPPLSVHGELTGQARAWASSMATTDQLAHAPDISRGISAPWTVLGENVGVHGVRDVRQLHAAFVASPGHYANIVDPRYTSIGVGVVVTEGGKLWTAHRFMATAAAPTTTAPPPTTAPPTTAAPTTAAPAAAPPTTRPPSTRPPTNRPPTTSPRPTTPSTTTSPAPVPPSTSSTTGPSATPDDRAPADGGEPADDAAKPPSTFVGSWPDEQAPAATADGDVIEPVAAGPGRPDLATVEQMLIDLIEAGI